MRKLEPVKDDALAFMGEVVSSSRKKGDNSEESRKITKIFRETCSTVLSDNEQVIKQYDDDFKANTMENLEDKGRLDAPHKDYFLSLYKYRSSKFVQLRNKVLTQNGIINETCPLCECDSVSTMDHYLPKEKYPLFVVHPRNLIPCCFSCNHNKNENVYKEGKRMFWNCYLDNPINTRYLYFSIKTNSGPLTGKFSINCDELTAQETFIIENTMNEDGQNVLNQYNKMVGNEIKELIKQISNLMVKGNGFDDCIRKIKEVNLPDIILNDWKDVLKDKLLNSDEFFKFAKEETEKIVKM